MVGRLGSGLGSGIGEGLWGLGGGFGGCMGAGFGRKIRGNSGEAFAGVGWEGAFGEGFRKGVWEGDLAGGFGKRFRVEGLGSVSETGGSGLIGMPARYQQWQLGSYAWIRMQLYIRQPFSPAAAQQQHTCGTYKLY